MGKVSVAPEPFTTPCAGCGEPRTTTMPFIRDGQRGLRAEELRDMNRKERRAWLKQELKRATKARRP